MDKYSQTLDDFIYASGKLSQKNTIDILKNIVEALVYIEEKTGYCVHRDIKSKNIFLDIEGNFYLGDFGTLIVGKEDIDSEIICCIERSPPEAFFTKKQALFLQL